MGKGLNTNADGTLFYPSHPLDDAKRGVVAEFTRRVADLEAFLAEQLEEDEHTAVKFLVAKGWDVEEAAAMFRELHQYMVEKGGISGMLEWAPPEGLVRYTPGGLFGEDREGRPIFWTPAGAMDPKGIFRCATAAQHVQFRLWQAAAMVRATRVQSKRLGRYVGNTTMVFDMAGTSMRQLHMGWLRTFNKTNVMVQRLFPELTQRILIINPPAVFRVGFRLVKPFLNERVLAKIQVLHGDPLEVLEPFVDRANILSIYGGKLGKMDPGGGAAVARTVAERERRAEFGTEAEYTAAVAEGFAWPALLSADGTAPLAGGGSVPAEYFGASSVDMSGATVVQVRARARHELSVQVGGGGDALEWAVKTASKDIGLALHFAPAAEGGQVECVRELELVNCSDCPEVDSVVCTEAGTYTLCFDNTHSMLTGKSVSYKLTLPGDGRVL